MPTLREEPVSHRTLPSLPVSPESSAISKYLIAEDLALRELEAELGEPIAKQVRVEFSDARFILDGLIEKGNEYIGIEVKYVRTPHVQPSTIQATLFKFVSLGSQVQTSKENPFRFIFIFVTEFSGEDLKRFKTRVRERFPTTLVPLEWRFYELSQLKKKFGVTGEQA